MKFSIFGTEKNLYILHGQVFVMVKVSYLFKRDCIRVFRKNALLDLLFLLNNSFHEVFSFFIFIFVLFFIHFIFISTHDSLLSLILSFDLNAFIHLHISLMCHEPVIVFTKIYFLHFLSLNLIKCILIKDFFFTSLLIFLLSPYHSFIVVFCESDYGKRNLFWSTLVVAIADLKMIRIKIIFKRILQKHKTRFFLKQTGPLDS